ncbi:sulfate adenylyltransferase subunit 1 [Clostridium homopropionicum DSM 5847]|uniref:sulfate adenylyltransferase n=1 Tax=Clostridium homopropionicum DSM 5847 TaxID=1121318 RepID=A0A0L6ZCL3_9CLOT|nr:GTP-binding protein [Clostridium homopropionicum]KOA20706.1 sulfate adenylyltransferase subunit 1 [Clostridium homopropionicum DSM 5847]SFF91052.1 sulfate adenylyltransferase subunit 1 [Clostridium homopropionicum]
MKSLLKFITCGSVDDGKSTLIGHILYDAKLLYADQKRALELDSRVGSRNGAIDYSLLLDGLMAEREQGITIDVAYRYFTTDNRSFIVADTPGHEEYTRNMAVGASFADLAVILIDIKQGVLVQTRRHARICSLMGIKYFIFAVNKMDLVEYDQKRFLEVEKEIKELEKELSLENIQIIPLSATEGDNIMVNSENIPWYTGLPLLPYLENIDVDNTSEEKGFYMPVQRVCRPNHTFRGFQGEIEAGSISVGDEVTALPSNEKALVKSILITDKNASSASKGQPVTIQLNKEVDVSRGCVLAKSGDIGTSNLITATVLWMDDSELNPGKNYFVKLGTKMLPGVVTEIKYKIDVNSGEHLIAGNLKKNEIAVCGISLSEKIPVDKFNLHKVLGELILIDRITNMTSACGVVESILEKEKNNEDNVAFQYNQLKARGDVFEEFYYNTESLSLSKYKPIQHTYTVGDKIPVKGESYKYPENIDILILRDWVAVKVRDQKISDIQSIDEYEYMGVPIVNGRGFAVKVNSNEEALKFLNEYKEMNEENEVEFLNKWVSLETYRSVIFHSNYWVI